jgi:hypothetical protein
VLHPFPRFARRLTLLIGALALGLFLIGCSGGGGGGAASAEASIGILQVGQATIFRVTVDSATGLEGASSFNLIGGADTTQRASFGNQVENYVVAPKEDITLAIYGSGGGMLGYANLTVGTFGNSFTGTVSLTRGTTTAAYQGTTVVDAGLSVAASLVPTQVGGLDVLARGVLENLSSAGTFTDVRVPLTCGGTTAGSGFNPGASDGFFIINDVAIEFNEAFDKPVQFNDILTVKFIESGRDFDNMDLYFKLPGAGRPVINARTGQVVPSANLPAIFGGVTTVVDDINPFGTAEAIVDLVITPFGASRLVETTVTSVTGDCVLGARSFYVLDANETPDPDDIVAIGETFDWPTQAPELILLILGDEVDQRDQTLNACDVWSAAQSGGFGTTIDNWDISAIPTGVVFDFQFNAFGIPDKFLVEYPTGTLRLDTGWRGSSSYNGNPLYPGGIAGPGAGEQLAIFNRGASNNVKVTVIGPESGTVWNYSIRCRTP